MKALAPLFLLASAALAQPFVYYGGAVNAGSYMAPGLPNSDIAQGSMFSIFGQNLGPATGQQVSAYPLEPTFAGVSVEISQGSTKVNALPAFVIASQLNVIMPSNAPTGAASLRVTYNGQTSNPIPIMIAASSVGIFTVNGAGFGPGIVQNVTTAGDVINSLTSTARPGQVEILWGTGLGPAAFADNIAASPGTIEPTTEVFVGGKKAAVSYAGRSPCCSSIDQIAFTVPADAPSGCYVPVAVRTKGTIVSNTVTMAIDAAGAPCSDAHNPLNSQRAGGKTAVAKLSRESIRVDTEGAPYDAVLDTMAAYFRTTAASDFYFNAATAPPPVGSCTVYSGRADRHGPAPLGPPGAQINPGAALKVEAATTVDVPSATGQEGTFVSLLGGTSQLSSLAPPVLTNGPFVLSSPGSASAQAFRISLNNVTALAWTNRDQISTIDRTKDLTLTWAAAPEASRGVMIAGQSARRATNVLGTFVCFAGSATSFTIPSYVLAALPASDPGLGFLSIGNVPLTSGATFPGFDSSFVGVSNWTSKTVVIK